MITVAVVGLGHSGANPARNIGALLDRLLRGLCDVRPDRPEHVDYTSKVWMPARYIRPVAEYQTKAWIQGAKTVREVKTI